MSQKIVKRVETFLRQAIQEDVQSKDITTDSIFPENISVKARIIAKSAGMVCGTKVVQKIAALTDKKITITIKRSDGRFVKNGDVVLLINGPIRSVLRLERLWLNFLGKLSGIATVTNQYVQKANNKKVQILDTRKTTPNMRIFERCAVLCGGGVNHRFGLFDQVLVKDNHIFAAQKYTKDKRSLSEVVKTIRSRIPRYIKIEIEVDTLTQLKDVLAGRPDIILLDNMDITRLKRAVEIVREYAKKNTCKRPLLEASGGITLKNIKQIAHTGIDRISVGALTHSAPQIDFSLEII